MQLSGIVIPHCIEVQNESTEIYRFFKLVYNKSATSVLECVHKSGLYSHNYRLQHFYLNVSYVIFLRDAAYSSNGICCFL